MIYYEKYVSNTLAASSNQSYFISDNIPTKCRIFYKIFSAGEYKYSLLFSNIVDSTFADGKHSWANYQCKGWEIISASISRVKKDEKDLSNPTFEEKKPLRFNGKASKWVNENELFNSDEIDFYFDKNDYLCLEIEFKGEEIPYLEENLIPIYTFNGDEWRLCNKAPLAQMVGINKRVRKKIGFLGDSITEGCGTEKNSYTQWNAIVAELTGEKYSYWNLGIGYGRANDIASDGSWLSKAKTLDTVTLCIGVNDICQGYSSEKTIENIEKIVNILLENGVEIILFTVPPFNWHGENIEKWKKVNKFIEEELSKKVKVFDTVEIWGKEKPNENLSKYGGHPNSEGCYELAKALVSKNLI